MQAVSLIEPQPERKRINADRVGVIASTLCAIHCAVTPPLLILLPTFGKIWAHPATHWGMALFVVPIAVAMMTAGYRQHRRKWIVAVGSLGVALVLIGAALPYLKSSDTATAAATPTPVSSESETNPSETALNEIEPSEAALGEAEHEESCETAHAESCEEADTCCPSVTTDAEGNTKLNIPASSIVTTLGGIALIITHVGNLCTCASCRRRKGIDCLTPEP